MSSMLPVANSEKPLEGIPCRYVGRQWMRSAKAWRSTIELPKDSILPALVTSLIESKVVVKIESDIDLEISPAYIVDVPSKGKKFMLVVETCYEHQANVGPTLTAITDTQIRLTIEPYREPASVPPAAKCASATGLSKQEITGLHLGFFQNERFWEFVAAKLDRAEPILSSAECKEEFKRLMNVDSTKEIDRDKFLELISEFNASLRGK